MMRLTLCLLVLMAAPVWAQDWSPPVVVATSEQAYGAADGTLVCVVTVTQRKVGCSDDEGATWRPLVQLSGTPQAVLERPIHIDGDIVAVFGFSASRTIVDWSGTRPVGPTFLWVSTDRGVTFSAPIPISAPTANAMRVSVWVTGTTIHMTWMDWHEAPPLPKGTWDTVYRRWANGVLGPVTVLAAGTSDIGAQRPSIAASGGVVWATWGDGRDYNPPCSIERGTVHPQCEELYGRRSVDGGVTWEAMRRLTFDAPYSGRQTIGTDGETWLITYDHRPAGQTNEVAILRSTDSGVNWTQGFILQSSAEQSHSSTFVSGTDAVSIWLEYGAVVSTSQDAGQTWTAPETLTPGSSVPQGAISEKYLHAFYTRGYPGALYHRRRPRTRTQPPPPPPPRGSCASSP